VEDVADAIDLWDSMFNTANGFSETRMAELSLVYHEALIDAGVGPITFEKLVKKANAGCRFFPKIADLLEFKEELNSSGHEMYKTSNLLQIEQLPSDPPVYLPLFKRILAASLGHKINSAQSEELFGLLQEFQEAGAQDYTPIEQMLDDAVSSTLWPDEETATGRSRKV